MRGIETFVCSTIYIYIHVYMCLYFTRKGLKQRFFLERSSCRSGEEQGWVIGRGD